MLFSANHRKLCALTVAAAVNRLQLPYDAYRRERQNALLSSVAYNRRQLTIIGWAYIPEGAVARRAGRSTAWQIEAALA